MTFIEHVERQWDGYDERHRNRTNLLIHIVGVPIAWLGAFQVIGGLLLTLLGVPGSFGMLFWGLVLFGASVFVQTRGDAMEAVKSVLPTPPAELAKSVAAEQFVNFPRFVLLGRWLRNFQSAA